VLDREGEPIGTTPDPNLADEDLIRMYETMVMVRAIDERGWQLQRSGRIAFWIPMRGQEAAHVGSAFVMKPSDWIFRGHRDLGAMLLRGCSLNQLFAQFFGRETEPLRGRRLPCLVGDRRLNIVSSTTQVGAYLPHASGAAWAAKLKGDDTRVMVYFGEGSSSRGEFHSAMNFASIEKLPLILFCENNSWAVSTPTNRQSATESFAKRGDAYGMRNLRVDGNDLLAVYAVTKEAYDLTDDVGPTLIEAVTYRLGFHTSSDNPALYRQDAEADLWTEWDPLPRTRRYLERRKLWSEERETEHWERCKEQIQQAIVAAEAMPLPAPDSQFQDVFADDTWMLREQRDRLLSDLDGSTSS
jgi:TPP-dependent pyruvate/acetoin dehydrogenase alpha subunit